MTEMGFLAYRDYVTVRQSANNAVMALLVGSRLAAHTLQLTTGSSHRLAELFPAVQHISRFNLRTEEAKNLLVDADGHLGAISVPYAQALHEDFVLTCLGMLKNAGVPVPGLRGVRSADMHETLLSATAQSDPGTSLVHFHLLRHMRNCQIHEGGRVSSALRAHVASMSATESDAWQGLSGRAPSEITSMSRIVLTSGDIVAAFAVAKSLGRVVNQAMQKAPIPVAEWAKYITADYDASTEKNRNSDQWMRALYRHSVRHYKAIGVPESELEDAAIELGYWDRGKGVVSPRASRPGKARRQPAGLNERGSSY
jgi:hypothetical protein